MQSEIRQPPADEASMDSEEATFFDRSRGCCCWFSPSWERIRASDDRRAAAVGGDLWDRAVRALMKVREWSEIVAGPRWKTFIRRFNRNPRSSRFGYDPMSYALNFDAQDGSPERSGGFRDFSSRFAALPASVESPEPAAVSGSAVR